VVDDATLRMLEDENFQKEVSQKDINGTRENMLGEKLLNVEQFPLIRVSAEKIDGEIPDIKIETAITIKDATYKVVIPANISISDNSLIASGKFELNQTEIGLVPFSAAGGALTVRDLLVFKYEIYAALE
jgi:polyisoprenoid-binding protein YceI